MSTGTKKSAPKPCDRYPFPASNDAAKSIPSPESRKQVNVSRIPNLEPSTCPFVFHLPLRPFYPFRDERFESRTSSILLIYIYIAVAAYYLNKSCGSVNRYLLYWLKNARPPFYARNLAPPRELETFCASFTSHTVHGFLLSVTWRGNAFPPKRMEDI